VVLVLYGITGALFAYCVSLMVKSPLAAFAAVAGYQIVMSIVSLYSLPWYSTDLSKLYLAGYLLILTYAKTSSAASIITIIHFTLSLLSPVASVVCLFYQLPVL
jgi:ATP-binding cassette subfamily A (ABC1) protein 3